MNKIIAAVFFASAMFVSSIAFSAEPLPKHSFQVATEIYSYVYDEPGIMRDEGFLYGLNGRYTYRFNDPRFSLRGEARGAVGHVDYDSQETGSLDDIPYYTFELRGLLGYDFLYKESYTQTQTYSVYAGLGFRYLNDDGGGQTTTTGNLSYDRESNYYYLPIGLEGEFAFSNGWAITAVLEYDYFLAGRQYSYLSTASPIYSDVTNNQNDGYGFRASMKFLKKDIHNGWDFYIEPFYRWWEIDESEVSQVNVVGLAGANAVEPHNETTEAGVNVGLVF